MTIDGVERGHYTYNAFGQRTRNIRTSTSATTSRLVYHYDLQGHLIAETRPNGTLVRRYKTSGSGLAQSYKTSGSGLAQSHPPL